jgi:Ca2+-binding RTX toxin-like protein
MVMKIGTDGADTLVGSDDNDTLQGLGGNDELTGGKGADVLDGGTGFDRANYAAAAEAVGVDLARSAGFSGDALGDILVSIEAVTGSTFGDVISGDALANLLSGLDGDDTLSGRAGNDSIFGGAGNDLIDGGPGADLLDGGAGIDTLYYGQSVGGVVVVLTSDRAGGGDAQDDVIAGFENVIGSAEGDRLSGDQGANGLFGGAGDDFIAGSGGNDVIAGGAGADNLFGGDGVDTLDYSTSASGVFVDLGTGQVFNGDADGDTITEFENVIGSQTVKNTLVGDDGANRLVGGVGDDSLFGFGGNDLIAGGAGADNLHGGDGIDTLDYRESVGPVSVNLATGVNSDGDTIDGFERVIGSALGDDLRGDGGANGLRGGAGNDFLFGGLGRDQLTGGTGADRFRFDSTAESGRTAATRDVIHDLHHADHDLIDFGQIDGSVSHGGKQDLTFIGHKAFTAEGQVRAFFEGGHTVIEVNTTGHSGAEMQIQLDHHVHLVKGDFAFAD